MLGSRGVAALVALFCVFTAPASAAPAAASPAAEQDAGAAREAGILWQRGYLLHELGYYEIAILHFRRSIALRPTAEGHTFLGWSLSHLGQLDEAIAECRKAIELDPEFGNPYNDIGVYLMALGRADEAVGWFDRAIAAGRYCCYQFPHFNKGRVLLGQGSVEAAQRAFERALEIDPGYVPAREALRQLKEEYGRPL